jgi:hypothetical protein
MAPANPCHTNCADTHLVQINDGEGLTPETDFLLPRCPGRCGQCPQTDRDGLIRRALSEGLSGVSIAEGNCGNCQVK